MTQEKISYKQKLWLNQHGGRTQDDVVFENGVPGIYQGVKGGGEKFYAIPTDRALKLFTHFEGSYNYPMLRNVVRDI